MGERFAEIIGDASSKDAYISRIFGVFFMFSATSSIWGQLISSIGIFKLLFFLN